MVILSKIAINAKSTVRVSIAVESSGEQYEMSWSNAMEPLPIPTSGVYSPYHRNPKSKPSHEIEDTNVVLYRMDSADGDDLDPKEPSNSERESKKLAATSSPPTPNDPTEHRRQREAEERRIQKQKTEEQRRVDDFALQAAIRAQYTSPWTMTYRCISCGVKDTYRQTERTMCKTCGKWVLAKIRTKRMVQFEAR